MNTKKMRKSAHLILAGCLLAGLFASNPVTAVGPGNRTLEPLIFPIPELTASAPTVDGACDTTEYTGGLFLNFVDGPNGEGTGFVYLLHDAMYMYMCITSPKGTYDTRFDSLYINPLGDGSTYTYAQETDYSLRLDFTGGKTTMRGDGTMGGWTDSSIYDNSIWSGATTTPGLDVAEYAIHLGKFGISVCTSVFRLAGYHHHFAGSGNDYGWPSNQYYDQPGTWKQVMLVSATCVQNVYLPFIRR